MRKIKIFLASSITEFEDERNAIGDYIRKIQDKLIDDNIRINLFECEFADNNIPLNKRMQEVYNEEIRKRDVFIMIIGNKVGQYTKEEYDVAKGVEGLKKYIIFKTCDHNQTVNEFKKEIDTTTYTYDYTSLEDLRLLITQIVINIICEEMLYKKDESIIQTIIEIAKEILENAKIKYRQNRDGKSKLELAQSYELVARQYNILVHDDDAGKPYPYDVEQSNKYIKCITELLSDFSKYGEYLTKVIDYEIEMLNLDEERLENEEYKINSNIINENREKAIKTLSLEDIYEYIKSIPQIDPIYEVAGYENLEELLKIYNEAKEFFKIYFNEILYSEEENSELKVKIRDIREGYNCLCIAKFGLDEKYISEIVNMLCSDPEEIGKVYSYKAYQYFNESTYIKRKRIIEEIEKFTQIREQEFQRDNHLDYIKSLYNIKRKMYINMIENDTLEEFEDEVIEENNLLAMKAYLWALIVRDDIHLSNNIHRTYSTLTNTLKDRKACLEIDKQRYQQKRDKKILEEIYQAQDYLIKDSYSTSSQVNEKTLYEYVLKDLEEIIEYQKSMDYLEKISEYEQRAEEYKKIIKEME